MPDDMELLIERNGVQFILTIDRTNAMCSPYPYILYVMHSQTGEPMQDCVKQTFEEVLDRIEAWSKKI
jgi:hypothetical protein